MIITDITQQKNNKDRCNVFVDGSYSFATFKEYVIKYNIGIGSEISKELIERILVDDEYRAGLDYALKRLSYKQFSKSELTKVLLDKGYDRRTIDIIQNKLADYKYIDDAELSRMIVSDATNVKKLGKRAVYVKMINRKIDSQSAKIAIEKIMPEDELKNAIEILEKYARKNNYDGKDQKIKQKIYRALASKGYDWDTIKEAFVRYGSDDEEEF